MMIFRYYFHYVSCVISTHLLQGRVGHPEAAEADVHEGLLQLSEEAGVGPGLEVTIWQQVGELLADGLDQTSLRHMVVDQGCDALHVTWRRVEKDYISAFMTVAPCFLWICLWFS